LHDCVSHFPATSGSSSPVPDPGDASVIGVYVWIFELVQK
jgi:hypothetical protein